MDLWDNLNSFGQHLIHGDLSGALGDIENAAQGAADDAVNTAQAALGAAQSALQGMKADKEMAKGSGGVRVPPPAAMTNAGATDQRCCNRFTFDSGFLLDGVTGRVWQFSSKSNTFTEVPIVNNKVKQGLVNSVIESKLSCFRHQYETEVLATIAPTKRAASLAQFEKDYLDPLRAAAQAVTY